MRPADGLSKNGNDHLHEEGKLDPTCGWHWLCLGANKNVDDEPNYGCSAFVYAGALLGSLRPRMAILWWRRRRTAILPAQTDQSPECRKLEKGLDVSHGRGRPRRQRHRPASHCALRIHSL